MTIIEDILTLEQKQKDLKASKGRYIQGIKTPDTIPKKGDKVDFVKLKKPGYEDTEIDFVPKEKDYQFQVNVWKNPKGDGFSIKARRDLGDGIIETVFKAVGEDTGTITRPEDIV